LAKIDKRLLAGQFISSTETGEMQCAMTREEIERRMGELARQYVETRDKKIIEELYELVRAFEKEDKKSD